MRSGDVYQVDFGWPVGSEAAFVRPAVVVTDDDILDSISETFQVVPFTSTVRNWPTDISSEWGEAQVHLITTISSFAAGDHLGTVGPAKLRALREVLSDLLGIA
jgi:mRNA-degrading endonuclease toxin of MazEF toxin-antitoxin module